jgi:hypothetical protein
LGLVFLLWAKHISKEKEEAEEEEMHVIFYDQVY